MAQKLKFTSQSILDKEFQGSTPGYNPLQVDEYLDKIIKDYEIIEANELVSKKEIEDFKREIKRLSEENEQLKLEKIRYEQRLANIKEADVVTSDNMDLIKRINALEVFIFSKGYDPSKIK